MTTAYYQMIETGNNIYISLKKYDDDFYKEYLLISNLKCMLLHDDVKSSSFEGITFDVYERADGYSVYYDDKVMNISVYDRQIVDFDVRSI